MSESIHGYVVQQLQEQWKGRWSEVSEATGISLRTIEKVGRQEYQSHRLSTIEPLYLFFRSQEGRRKRNS